MDHPGHWKNFSLRKDNKGLPFHRLRDKYLREYYLFEEFQSFQLQQMNKFHRGLPMGGGRRVFPLTWEMYISSPSATTINYYYIQTNTYTPLTVVTAWTINGQTTELITEIPANSAVTIPVDLGIAASNILFTISFSDASAVNQLALFGDVNSTGQYVIETMPDNIYSLINSQYLTFVSHTATSEVNLTNFTGGNFIYNDDLTIQSVNITNLNLTNTLNFSGCQNLNTITISDNLYPTFLTAAFFNCALTETTVNNFLIAIDNSGLLPSSPASEIKLDGGSNAVPTGAGSTAKTNLINKGWAVTTN